MSRAPFIAMSDDRVNASVVDEWSLVHFGTGFIAGAVGLNAWIWVIGHVAYEAAELAHETPSGSKIFGTKRPEWDVNMVADLSIGFGAYVLGRWLRGDAVPEPPPLQQPR